MSRSDRPNTGKASQSKGKAKHGRPNSAVSRNSSTRLGGGAEGRTDVVPPPLPEGGVDVDGSILEGGGQILRMSMGFATLFKKSVRINKIRAGRSKPGLRPQHLCGIQLVAESISKGTLSGGSIGSACVSFVPGTCDDGSRDFLADTGTAGSCTLLLQVSLPVLICQREGATLELRGGTNAEMAPQIDFTTCCFIPTLKRLMGIEVDVEIKRRGFFPKGGGVVFAKVLPRREALNSFDITERGHIVRIFGKAITAGGCPKSVGARMKIAAEKEISASDLGELANVKVDIETYHDDEVLGGGACMQIFAETSTGCILSGSAIGAFKVPAEKVGTDAAMMLLKHIREGGCVDEWLQDQLIIFMALAKGRSRMLTGPLSLHTKTAIHISELLTGAKFTVAQGEEGGKYPAFTNVVECEGVAFVQQ